jgi:hypothetical protein
VTANRIRYPRRRNTKAWMNAVVAIRPSSAISSYIRVSIAYLVRKALKANSVAAINPALRPKRLQPDHMPTGIVSRPNRSESEWVADSLLPKACIQKWSSM